MKHPIKPNEGLTEANWYEKFESLCKWLDINRNGIDTFAKDELALFVKTVIWSMEGREWQRK